MYQPQIGDPLEALDTPSMIVDLTLMEENNGILTWEENVALPPGALSIGKRIEFIPGHIDTTINLHDTCYAYRDGKIAAIWPVSARGKAQ